MIAKANFFIRRSPRLNSPSSPSGSTAGLGDAYVQHLAVSAARVKRRLQVLGLNHRWLCLFSVAHLWKAWL
jgi:hypothetical protein